MKITAGNAATATPAKISVTASWTDASDTGDPNKTATAECSLTITDPPTTTVPVDSIALDRTTLSLKVGDSAQLNAIVKPDDATDKTVDWRVTRNGDVVSVDPSGKVTALKEGEATITATAGGKTATCTVTVTAATANGLAFTNPAAVVRGLDDPNPWDLTVSLLPMGAALEEGDRVEWTIVNKDASAPTENTPTGCEEATGLTVRLTNGRNSAGEYIVTAQLYRGETKLGQAATKEVQISGITLTSSKVKMLVGEAKVIAIDQMYGYAKSGSPTDVVWTSSDPSTVTVMNGELVAWKLGTAIITANKNGYTAECEVTVGEDEDVIAGPYSATTGEPLIFSVTYDDLNEICKKKTEVRDANDEVTEAGSPLRYITNVMVPTDQGTLYYNYNSEANTGAGVGVTDRFARTANGSIRSMDLLYFVPRQGFSGTAEITFNGVAENGRTFSGTIRVSVTGVDHISYRTNASQPAHFLSGDFNAYCRNVTGRNISYVTFNLPQTSQGTLYYNYTAPGQPGDRVTTSTQYGRSGRYTIDDVCFVPNDAFVGTARISYRGVDTAGKAFNGEVEIIVTPAGAGDAANVYISAQRGQPVALQSNLFNDACQATIRDTLSYVYFKLPAYDEGTLYYNYRGAGNYDSRVAATTRYYYSGVPGISGVTFVPASNNTGRVAIPYTGYGASGTTYTGTLYISMGDNERATIRYFVPKNGVISFSPNDFNNAALLQMGAGMEYVEFQLSNVSEFSQGTLYYDYRSSTEYGGLYSDTPYYRTPKDSWQNQLGLISFRATALAGSVTVPYTAYSAADGTTGKRESFEGIVVIQVGSPTPADVNASCNTSGQVWLSSYTLGSVCAPVMDKGLSYIEITSLPPAEEGRLYFGYNGFKTGTEVKQGDRFYCLGAPGIDQVTFVPRGGFTGKTELTYVGFSSDGKEQVSGRVIVTVNRANASRYFNDMANHVWAVDSVDYLYQNKAVNGVGGGRYNPTGYISKGDFTLMLVRAFGFTANGSVTYRDVPAGSYYAEAINIASLLGIASGSSGYYFPNRALSRQDAMVMIYNALVADGRKPTNGLAADLTGYHDYAQIATYARPAMGSLVQMGIVKGDGNGFLRPQSLLNRAETAMLLHTIMTM